MKINSIFLLFILFITLRLILIFSLPPFVDELNYAWWGQRMINEPGLSFASISVWGKQPLPFWIFGLASSLTPNFLIGARLISLIIGIPGFFMLYYLTRSLKNHQTAIWSLVFFTLCPYFVFHQSVALIDGMLLTLNLAILVVLFALWKKIRFKFLVLLGLLLGLVFWVKTTSIVIIVLSLFSLIWILQQVNSKSKDKSSKLIRSVLMICLVTLITSLIILPLILRSDFSLIIKVTAFFSLKPGEFLEVPVSNWLSNFLIIYLSLLIYLTPAFFSSIFFIFKEIRKSKIQFLVAWFLISVFSLILTASFLRLRYFLFTMAAFLPLAGIGISHILTKKPKPLGKLVIFAPLVAEVILLILSPITFFSLFPKNTLLEGERDYIFGVPSGYNLGQASGYFDQIRSKKGLVTLMFPFNYGNATYSFLNLKYHQNKQVSLMPLSIDSENEIIASLKPLTKSAPIYFISNNQQLSEKIIPHLKLIKKFEKPGKEDYIGVYQIRFKGQ